MQMNEKLLQQIWAHQYFNTRELQLSDGSALEIISPGKFNSNQGPDFLEARLRIDGMQLAGNIEIHVLASDWKRHEHDADPNFRNIILHVVWINDWSVEYTRLPTLELQPRVAHGLLEKYAGWILNKQFIPCGDQIARAEKNSMAHWLEQLAAERFQRKHLAITSMLDRNNSHWEEVLWWLLARNFGYSINSQAFETIARSVPYTIMLRHKPMVIQLEAILFGQAGLLSCKLNDEYAVMLQQEYRFYQKKYQLKPAVVPIHFLRMRPVNFPTIRLAQLAMLISTAPPLFNLIREGDSLKMLFRQFEVTANDYWHYRYVFDQPSAFRPKKLGDTMIQNILMNTVLPAMYSYGVMHDNHKLSAKAMEWLCQLPAEKNRILLGYEQLGINASNALEGQALLELKSNYCDQQRCLDCAIGKQLLQEQHAVSSS